MFLTTQACSATQWGVLGRQACSGHEATAQLPGHRVQNGAMGSMALLSGVQAVVGTPPAIHARPAIRAVSTCGAAWEEGCGLRGRRAPQYRAGGAPERAPSCVQEDRRGQGWTEVTAPMDLTGARPCLVRHEGGCPAEAPSGQPDSRVSPHFPTHTPLCEPPLSSPRGPPSSPVPVSSALIFTPHPCLTAVLFPPQGSWPPPDAEEPWGPMPPRLPQRASSCCCPWGPLCLPPSWAVLSHGPGVWPAQMPPSERSSQPEAGGPSSSL